MRSNKGEGEREREREIHKHSTSANQFYNNKWIIAFCLFVVVKYSYDAT